MTPAGAPDREGFWRGGLAESVPVELPRDRPRLASRSPRRLVARRPLGAELVAAIRARSTAHGVPTLATLLAAFYVLLQRHTGERDLIVCALPGPGDGELLPLRVRVEPSASFGTLLGATTDAIQRAREHGTVTGQELLGWAGGDAARVGVVLDDPGGAPAAPVEARFELALALQDLDELDGGHGVGLAYADDLFEEATIAWLLEHYVAILTSATERPGVPLRDLRMAGAQRGPRAPWALPRPPGYLDSPPPDDAETLVRRFRTTAGAHGARPAVTGASGALTYAELDDATERLARGLGGAARIALLCEHDLACVVGVIAALKAGAAYVPLDPRHPDARLRELLAAAGVDRLLCDAALRARASMLAGRTPVVPIAAEGAAGGGPGRAEPAEPASLPEPSPDSVAYLLHTSGSTGRPKAVVQRHGNVLAHAVRYADRVRMGPGDRVIMFARYTFDAAVMDLFGALLSGASLYLADPLGEATTLAAVLERAAPTIVHCTPTLFRHLMARVDGDASGGLARARVVVLGGEEATASDVDAFYRRFGADASLVNGLGPTECTVALQHLVTPDDRARAKIPVGHPVEGVDVELLDEDGGPAEVLGELVLVSRHVALGYWGQPEPTSAAFGVSANGTPRYRTGDVVRRRADGSLVYCWRRDRQVKIRGHRVEPGEAESMLRAHPTVAQAAVILDARSPQGPRLVGYVTSATPMPADAAELDEYLRRYLPDYAIPARLVVLDALPIGPTGKLDRSRLPSPDDPDAGSADGAARSPLEHEVAAVWCKVLGLASVNVHHDFIASGGDSLQIMRMLDLLKERFGVEIPLLAFIRAPTVVGIVEQLEQSGVAAPALADPPAP